MTSPATVTRRTALALGGGGARGYAHIGVIRALEERGHEITAVSGTSMGAVIGGLYCAGKLDAYTDWVSGLSQRDVIRLLDPSFKAPGIIKAEKVMGLVRELLAGVRIEDLPIPFTAVATDLIAQREVWLQDGPLGDALRASIAIPSAIAPVVIDGRLLADGGLLNTVPISPLTGSRADVVVAVSLGGARTVSASLPRGMLATEERFESLRRVAAQVRDQDVVRAMAARLGMDWTDVPATADSSVRQDASAAHIPVGMRAFDVVEMALETMQRLITRYRLSGYPPDVLIELPIDSCGTLDFHRAPEMIELGYRYACDVLDAAAPEGDEPGPSD